MRVLIVAMCDSVHTAGWIRQFVGTSVEIVLYPSTPHRRLHPEIRKFLRDSDALQISMNRWDRYTAFALGILDLFLRNQLRARRLATLIKRGDVDFVHLLETQHAGYLFLAASKKRTPSIPVALSIWGSDLNWFASDPRHHQRILATLSLVDHMFIECRRDQQLAEQLGFAGRFSVPIPASGGLVGSRSGFSALPLPSTRTVVVVKGYTGFMGRARVALRALMEAEEVMIGYTVHFYSVGLLMHLRLVLAREKCRFEIVSHRKKSLSRDQMLDLFASARMSLALSASDGLSGSMREAAFTGAFPIESCGSCVAEWAEAGKGVMVVDPTDEQMVVDAVRQVMSDDVLVDEAVMSNAKFVARLEFDTVRSVALREYETIAQSR